jgi:hypothetical protein
LRRSRGGVVVRDRLVSDKEEEVGAPNKAKGVGAGLCLEGLAQAVKLQAVRHPRLLFRLLISAITGGSDRRDGYQQFDSTLLQKEQQLEWGKAFNAVRGIKILVKC